MFDFGLGEKSNHQAIMDFYGYDLYNRIRREIRASYDGPYDKREAGNITKELWQLLRDIRAGRTPSANSKPEKVSLEPRTKNQEKPSTAAKPVESKPDPSPQSIQRQRQAGDDFKLITERGLIRNDNYRDLFKGPGTVYEFIWANLVRIGWHDTEEFPIRRMYHDDQKLLVYCTTYRHIADKCGMSHNTVKKIIGRFKEAGIIKIEKFRPIGKPKAHEQVVLILGEWSGSGKTYREHLFRDEVLLSKPNGLK